MSSVPTSPPIHAFSSATTSGPIPPFPEKTTIPVFKTTQTPLPDQKIPSALSFYYAGISSIWLWYRAPMDTLRAYTEPLGMTPYDFGGGEGAVNVNFFNAVCFYGQGQPGNQGLGGFSETEINVMAYATKVAANVPTNIPLEQYLISGDPTKRIGNYRVWVACDDPVAVACGIQVFMENKFLVAYDYDIPGPNNAHTKPGTEFTYDWTCVDTDGASIYNATLKLDGLSCVPGNMSEVIDLSFDQASRRPVGSRRNYLGLFDTYSPAAGEQGSGAEVRQERERDAPRHGAVDRQVDAGGDPDVQEPDLHRGSGRLLRRPVSAPPPGGHAREPTTRISCAAYGDGRGVHAR